MSTLPRDIVDALNHQIKMEAYASQFYLALAYWCDDKALKGCKAFFERQSEEEREHKLKIYEYLSDQGEQPVTPGIEKPPMDFSSVKHVFQMVLEQEQKVTKSIHDIVKLCYRDSDFNTLSFLQWFVDEQREEEGLINDILSRIDIIGEGGQSLYYIDKEIDTINANELAKEAAAE